MQVKEIYAAIERLRPKRVIGTECGHAHRASVIEGSYWAGRPDGKPPAEYIHYVQWVAEALWEGTIKINPAKKIREKARSRTPATMCATTALSKYTREIISYIVEDGYFVEMSSNRKHNYYCCGGGFSGVGMYRPQRNVALWTKRDQILATGAKLVIAPCHNCWDAIRDLERKV